MPAQTKRNVAVRGNGEPGCLLSIAADKKRWVPAVTGSRALASRSYRNL